MNLAIVSSLEIAIMAAKKWCNSPEFITALGGAVIGILTGLLIVNVDSSIKMMAIALAVVALVGIIAKTEWALFALVFILYSRVSDVMVHEHELPSIAKPFIILVLVIALVRWIFYDERQPGWEKPTLLLSGYCLAGLASLAVADYHEQTIEALNILGKNMMIVAILFIMLQKLRTLHLIIWGLLLGGIFLGSITLFQYLSGTLDNNYGGFAQAEILNIVSQTNSYRISGPIGDPNYYAQILLIILPIALERAKNESSITLRALAIWAFSACLLSIIFTFSRGAMVAIAVMVGIMMIRTPPAPFKIFASILLIIMLLPFVPEQYYERLQTIINLIPGLDEQKIGNEASFRGRLSEMIVGGLMFFDHPLLGVGLNNYSLHYQNYSQIVGLDLRLGERQPHNLFLELAAENGLVGLIIFCLMLWFLFQGLRSAQDLLLSKNLRREGEMISAFKLALIGYLTAAMFLHGAYPRYLWMLVGIGFAIPQVVKQAVRRTTKDLNFQGRA